jgi:hypothetical protein
MKISIERNKEKKFPLKAKFMVSLVISSTNNKKRSKRKKIKI